MTSLLLVTTCLLAVAFAFVLAAQVEFSRQLEEIRRISNIGSQARLIDLRHTDGPLPDEVLPREISSFEGNAHLFFLSSSCYTCEGIASLLLGTLPSSVWLVVDETPRLRPGAPLEALIEEAGERVLRDDGSLSEALGVHATPSLVVLESGVPTAGFVLSTAEQFREIVPVEPAWMSKRELALAD
jgi:hypothetical protein